MPDEGIFIVNEDGEQEYVLIKDLDVKPQWKPIGGFCYYAPHFLGLNLPPAPFYIKDWLPKLGRLELFAPAKAGKSFLSLQLAHSIGQGLPFLNLETEQGKVLVLQFELGHEVLQYRMRLTGKDYKNVYVGTTFAMKLDTQAGQDQILRAMEDIKPDVLILDPWYKLLKGDENEAQDVEKITDFLDTKIIQLHRCSIVVVHHSGKDRSRGGRGSSVLEGWVDSYIAMQKTSKNGEPLKIKLTPLMLRHAALPPEPIEAVMGSDFEFHMVEEKQALRDRLAEYLAHKDVAVGATKLATEGIGSREAIQRELGKMVEEGQVSKAGGGYMWTGGENS